jgi:hypothetical protein
MPLFAQCSAEKMGASAGFHANQRDLPIRGEAQKLRTGELLAQQIKSNQ